MIRKPIVAGQFYAADPKELEKQINDSFLHKLGPGKLPSKRTRLKIKAIIAPHAGYVFSGPCAAHAYNEIAKAEFPDVFIVIGPNHTGFGKSSISYRDYKTPLGVVRTDQEMAKLIAKGTELIDDGHSHMNEHSVEVQIPFLQFACKDRINDLKIVPIVISGELDNVKLAKDLMTVLKKSSKKVILIVSSDMTHFGWNYGYIPFDTDIKKNLYDLDKKTIKLIEKSNYEEFEKRLDETGSTVCGRWPIAILLNAIKAKKINLLKYYTSADIIGDYTNAVGYAAIVFK